MRALCFLVLGMGCMGVGGMGVGCSSNPVVTPDAGTDSGDMDVGMPDSGPGYPAPHSAMPQAVTRKGPVMASPKLVAITFANDPLVSDIDDFMSKISGAKDYWAGATAEYGVGPASTLPAIHSTDTAPAMVSDSDVQAWLTTQIQSTANFPQPDANTLYTVFYPTGVTVSMGGGVGCQNFNGYHGDFSYNGQFVSYAVIPRCPPPVMKDTLTDMMAATTSHELIEAATDPLPIDKPAYIDVDNDHLVWSAIAGGETGDLCAPFPGVFSRTMTDLNYLVQRTWSNQAANAGHDPCAPHGVTPYFNSAPVLNDTVTFTLPGLGKRATKGVLIPVGQSATVELDLYSDAPTSGPWTVSAIDLGAAFMGQSPALTFAFDKTTGQNGDVIQMTITVKKKNTTYNAEPFWIINKLDMQTTIWVGLVGN